MLLFPLLGRTSGLAFLLALLAPTRVPAQGRIAEGARVPPEVWRGLVLAGLRADEFQVAYRYRNFPALTGHARAEALELLALHPDVERVGLDLEGVPALDTGVDSDHPDLVDSLRPGAMHFLLQGGNVGPGAEDFSGHGTNVTGIITSSGTIAPRGVAPDANVLALQVINPATGTGFLSDWAAAVDHVVSVQASHPHLILSTGLNGGTVQMGGTSQAAPHVTAVLALMAERRSGWSPLGFPLLMQWTGAPTSSDCITPFPLPRRVDALGAVRALFVRRR